jgi:N-acetylglucosaminyl-diphospho-decaprenol L-rhamnosyltransferase
MTIDVVVVAHDRWDLTESCLRHLSEQTVAHRVFLVDNASSDGTADRAAGAFPGVEVIQLDQLKPFAVACNRGVGAGSGDVVVMLNNDVDCRSDFLEKVGMPLRQVPGVGLTSCLLLRPGGETVDSVAVTVDRTLASFQRFHGAPVAVAGGPGPAAAVPSGAAAAIRREAWEAAGGLDEAIFAYGEDLDLFLRIRTVGWGHAVVPEAVATHVGSASFGHRSAWQRRNAGFGRGYILRRYGVLRSRAAPRALITELIVVVGDALISRDLAAAAGRLAGWRAAGGKPRHPMPPADAIDQRLGFWESLRLRRGVYWRPDGSS